MAYDNNAYLRKRYANDPKYREKKINYLRIYRKENANILSIKQKAKYQKNREQIRTRRNTSINYKFTYYKMNSKKRGYNFSLSFEQFKELIEGNCVYCGNGNNNGIDRIDSSKGYVEGNVVTCCFNCNRAKSNLSQEEFAKQIMVCSIWAKKYLNLE